MFNKKIKQTKRGLMKYPYFLYDRCIDHAPVFKGLTGMPFVADMSGSNPVLNEIDVRDQKGFQAMLEKQMAPRFSWGVAGYLEYRDSLLRDCPQMVSEGRFFHLGLDVIVPLGTSVHAPLNSIVAETGYEEGEGNYGGYALLKHEDGEFEPFYSFYGHLGRDALPETGRHLKAGQAFAQIGDFHENGNWFYHTHIQIITMEGFRQGYVSKGYCSVQTLGKIDGLCPSPVPLFITA
jgi:hypothetical protein